MRSMPLPHDTVVKEQMRTWPGEEGAATSAVYISEAPLKRIPSSFLSPPPQDQDPSLVSIM